MEDSKKGFFYILGVIVAVYLLIRYVLPIVIKTLGWAFGVLLKVIIAAAIIFIIVIITGYIIKWIKNR